MNGFDDDFEEIEVNKPKFNYAPLLKRGLAMAIDLFICAFIISLYLTSTVEVKDDPKVIQEMILKNAGYSQVYMYLLFFLYFILLESSKLQASLGKLILGIKVTDLEGGRLHHTQVAMRTMVKILAFSPIFIIFYLLIVNEKRQCLHDVWAKSIVILKNK